MPPTSLFPPTTRRLWLGPVDDRPRTVLFRRTFTLPASARATLRLYAEGRFQLWCNAAYVTRGPLLHHPHCRSVLDYDLTPHLRPGHNTLAILAQSPGTSIHNLVWSAEPGPVALLQITHPDGRTEEIVTDDHWRATDQTGWITDVPRRGWATAWIEVLDARHAPMNWQDIAFDDSAWLTPNCLPPSNIPGMQWQLADVPPVIAETLPFPEPTAIFTAPPAAVPLDHKMATADFGAALLAELWQPWPPQSHARYRSHGAGSFEILQASPDHATALVFDLQKETTGQLVFDLDSDSAGIVDIAWSEVMHHDRPNMMLKGNTYADRLLARPGHQHWEPVNYSAFRYITLIFRGFSGRISVKNAHARATRMGVDLSHASFHCSDDSLNRIWDMCVHTLRISPQEGVTDCPTREQAVYLADSPLVAGFLAMLSGDFRPWRHTLREVFLRPGANGLLKDAVYSSSLRSLADFNLVAIMSLGDYLRRTQDRALASELRPAAENALRWFLDRCNPAGLLAIDWDHQRKTQNPGNEPRFTGDPLPDLVPWLFIDHPGMGWHNQNEPGIDRRGINAAMHALLALACDAIADLAALLGDDAAKIGSRNRAQTFRDLLLQHFYDPSRKRFADALISGALSPQSSQQTNTLGLLALAGHNDDLVRDRVADILRPHEGSAWNGPYFWNFLLPLAARYACHSEALAHIRTLWGKMIEHGATTLWETFAGDHLDSWCHPWSAAPLPFLAQHILGIHPPASPADPWRIQPQYQLIPEATGSLPINPAGQTIHVSWKPLDSRTRLEVTLPPTITADLHHPYGKKLAPIPGHLVLTL